MGWVLASRLVLLLIQGGSVVNSDSRLAPISEAPADADSGLAPSLGDRPVFGGWRQRLLVGAGLVILVGVGVGAARQFNNFSPAETATRLLPVITTQVQPVNAYSVTRAYTGEVVAARTSELGFERSGRVVEVLVEQGDRVAAGTPLARLDTQNLIPQRLQLLAQKAQAQATLQELRNGPRAETIATARSQVRELENQLALEQSRRNRREYLYQEGAIAQEQLEDVSFNQKALSDRLAAAQSQLQELEAGTRPEQIAAQGAVVEQLAARIADLEVTIAKSTLKAPFPGLIAQRPVAAGTVVNGGQMVVRLVEATQSQVEIGVPGENLASLALGSAQTLQIGDKTYPATVTALLPEVNPTTRTHTVVFRLDNLDPALAPGQIARLSLTQTVPTPGFWLPMSALTRSDRGLWACYVAAIADPATGAATVERRDLEVLYIAGDRVLVRGILQTGDRVISDGIQRLVPGQAVQISPLPPAES